MISATYSIRWANAYGHEPVLWNRFMKPQEKTMNRFKLSKIVSAITLGFALSAPAFAADEGKTTR